MKFRKLLFVALVALVVASAIGYFSKTMPYYEKLIRIQAEQKLGHIDSRILDEPLDIQALLMDYSDQNELDQKARNKDLVLKAWIALSKYPEQSREVFRLYGSLPEFQVILRDYEEPVIPVIMYFLTNDDLSVKTMIKVGSAISTAQQGVVNAWNRLKGNMPNSNPAPQQAKSELGRADAMSKAEVLSRMAAATGDVGDQVTLAAVLLLQSAIYRDQGCADQGLAYAREADAVFLRIMQADDETGRTLLLSVVSSLADNGDDLAALMLDNLVASMPARVASGASAAVRRLDAAHG